MDECTASYAGKQKQNQMLTNNGNVVVQSSSYFLAYLLILHPVHPLEEPNVVSGVKSSDNCCATRKFGSFQLFFKYLKNNIWSKRNPLLTSFFSSFFCSSEGCLFCQVQQALKCVCVAQDAQRVKYQKFSKSSKV